MSSILVQGLNPETIRRLKKRARRNGRSLQQEVKAILERGAQTLTMSEARRLRRSRRWAREGDQLGRLDSGVGAPFGAQPA